MKRRAHQFASIFLAASFVAVGCAAADRPLVVPITLIGHFPVVEVTINGSTVPLIFDSGSSASVALTQAVLDRVNASPTGTSSRAVDAQGNVLVYPKYSIGRVQIGAAIFTDVVGQLDVHDPSYQATQVGQQGFLGTSLLKDYRVVLDYPRLRMTLVPSGGSKDEATDCTGTAVTFAPQWHGEPVAEVGTDSGRVVVWWDTGTPTSVLSKRFIEATGSPQSQATWTSRRLALGDADFGPWQFEIWDVSLPHGFEGFIGYDFFAKHVVCMDFPARRLLIQR
jgi:Aspartyl protease